MKNKLKIVFMGTPDFAVGVLKSILETEHEVVGVITAVDKPAGRGRKINTSAVKKYSLEQNLNLLQPPNLKDPAFIEQLKELKADIQIVVAFRMLPKQVWSMPKIGTFNLHASLLPQYRGAAPIHWAIINGETKTGVTTFFIDDKIDTGEIILKEEIEIKNDDTVGILHDKLMKIGCDLVVKTLDLAKNEEIETFKQENIELKTAYKLNPKNCKIDWTKNTIEVYNHIRGLNPFPCAWTTLIKDKKEYKVKIYNIEKETNKDKALTTGKISKINNKEIKISTNDGYIIIKELQVEGKRKMNISDLLNGFDINENHLFL